MAVNDPYNLIGEWTFNDPFSPTSSFDFDVNFISGGYNYVQLYGSVSSMTYYTGTHYHAAWQTGYGDYNGWYNNGKYRTINITGGSDLSNVSFANWLKANAVKSVVITLTTITYNGAELASLEEGQTANFDCNGKKAVGAVSILFDSKGSITYKGVTTEIEAGKTANLLCAGKKFGSDVVVAVEKAITHYLYNGVKLPKIPEDVLAEYPYCWIRKNTTGGYYDLLLTKLKWFLDSSGKMNISESSGKQGQWYQIPIADSGNFAQWVYKMDITAGNLSINSSQAVLWSNHDIPNGSATATDIYFEGSDPVPCV